MKEQIWQDAYDKLKQENQEYFEEVIELKNELKSFEQRLNYNNLIKLEKENQELKDKLNHIKIVGFGNAHTIEKELEEYFEKYFEKSKTLSFEDIIAIMWKEVEKTDNLCLMCDGVNKYVKYEHALENTIQKLKNIKEFSHSDSYAYKKIPELLKNIENALNIPTAKEAIKKAHSEFEKYYNKTSL